MITYTHTHIYIYILNEYYIFSLSFLEPWISISHNNTRLYTSKPLKFSKTTSIGTIMCDDLRISGDIRMEFYHKSSSVNILIQFYLFIYLFIYYSLLLTIFYYLLFIIR